MVARKFMICRVPNFWEGGRSVGLFYTREGIKPRWRPYLPLLADRPKPPAPHLPLSDGSADKAFPDHSIWLRCEGVSGVLLRVGIGENGFGRDLETGQDSATVECAFFIYGTQGLGRGHKHRHAANWDTSPHRECPPECRFRASCVYQALYQLGR